MKRFRNRRHVHALALRLNAIDVGKICGVFARKSVNMRANSGRADAFAIGPCRAFSSASGVPPPRSCTISFTPVVLNPRTGGGGKADPRLANLRKLRLVASRMPRSDFAGSFFRSSKDSKMQMTVPLFDAVACVIIELPIRLIV